MKEYLNDLKRIINILGTGVHFFALVFGCYIKKCICTPLHALHFVVFISLVVLAFLSLMIIFSFLCVLFAIFLSVPY